MNIGCFSKVKFSSLLSFKWYSRKKACVITNNLANVRGKIKEPTKSKHKFAAVRYIQFQQP